MCFYCVVNVTVLKVNLNIALVMMVKKPVGEFKVTNVTEKGTTCKELLASVSNRTVKELHGGEFNWSRPLQGNLLGAFQIGSVFTPIPFTILGSKLHASKWILAFGGLLSGVMSLLAPVCARWHVGALIASKAIEGLGAGITYPNIHCLVTNWIPNIERSRVNAFIYNGIAFATVATYTLSGPLMKSGFLGGWPAVFYISGLSVVVWFIVWIFLVYESPNEHPHITQEELDYITEKVEHKADTAL
nr:putative inorganic phosphate cotransporter [Parasteatoda tepidariorum]